MGNKWPTDEDRAFLEFLFDSVGCRADASALGQFRTEAGERAKRRCARYGWAIYHCIGPSWAITPAGRAALQSQGASDV